MTRNELIEQIETVLEVAFVQEDNFTVTANTILSTILAALQEDKALQEIIERYFNFPHGKGFGKERLAVFLNASPLGEQRE